MLSKHIYRFFCALTLFLSSGLAFATVMVVNFDSFGDSEVLSNQIVGLTFQNSTVLTAGVSLNEFEFPPHSDFNVVVDDGGAITINFDSPVTVVSGFFTYLSQLTLDAFDSGSNLVATDLSDFASNTALSGVIGSSPNELLSVSSATGIARIVLTGDPAGFSFVMDDLTVTTGDNGNSVPEPGTLPLFVTAIVAAALTVGRSRRRVVT